MPVREPIYLLKALVKWHLGLAQDMRHAVWNVTGVVVCLGIMFYIEYLRRLCYDGMQIGGNRGTVVMHWTAGQQVERLILYLLHDS